MNSCLAKENTLKAIPGEISSETANCKLLSQATTTLENHSYVKAKKTEFGI